MNTPIDKRDKLWSKLEADVKLRALKKDKRFKLSGKWKKFIRKQSDFKVYAVDGTWIRNNLSVIFGHGGHGYVHEFIPLDEIWIATKHYKENKFSSCNCNNSKDGQLVSKNYFDSTTLHEIVEYQAMKKGASFWRAHNIALEAERKANLLPDPFTEI